MICRVAGTGQLGFNGDGLQAEDSWLYWPTALEFVKAQPPGIPGDSLAGQLAIVDFNNMRVRVWTPENTLQTIAGNGNHARASPGSTALTSALENPVDVAFLPDGGFYIAPLHEARILKVAPDGLITAVAGTGTIGFAGDGGPASEAEISEAAGITVDASGNLYIADTQNHCIRKVTPEGLIETLAGHGVAGYAGDNNSLDMVLFNTPERIVWAPSNETHGESLYIADSFNHAIRRLDLESGIATTVAGAGFAGYEGDGEQATLASLNTPYGMDLSPDGSLYIADSGNNVIRKVSPDGIIETIAGTGEAGLTEDEQPALEAMLSLPVDVLVAPEETGFYFADMRNGAVRFVRE
jgi:sugar lactone lactonase YvrE